MSGFRDMKIWLFVCLVATLAHASQAIAAPTALGELTLEGQILAAALSDKKTRPFSGVVIIAQGKHVLFSYAHGVSTPITVNSRFLIGSLSKQITAVLALQQAQAGALRLNASPADYDLSLSEPWLKQVQVGELLNHTSGVTRPGAPLKFQSGDGFAYSNYGYEITGELIAQLSGRSYRELAAKLFERCGMTESVVPEANNATYPANLAQGFSEDEQGGLAAADRKVSSQHAPSSGVVSTAMDLVRWNQCLHDGVALEPEWYGKMTQASATRSHRWGDLGYGYGVQVSRQGPREYSHSGYVPGYISTLSYFPERKISLVVLENVSWSVRDMDRVFHHHDQVRSLLMQALQTSPTTVATQGRQ
ncbi:class A beta-lactamase-related serine hydrolase [Hahella sp. KA22]|uniref:serine hydrolase domain-containing protein n=1 Tax=Hahella sp. KA22 TaxID=1628392 RepID=UPI000FDD9AB5|nr:serine hydrolase domain-containing protein [Hahella sp. KA22]AZZ92270.1 class A beta-lactamase-related serine hydrolase [Hahella sp. KA22]QAY55641.1 class A beta-lactamase-related serine hydrolase [Hahella sp. KA22]